MREIGHLTDDDMNCNPTLAAAWALANEYMPEAIAAAEAAGSYQGVMQPR